MKKHLTVRVKIFGRVPKPGSGAAVSRISLNSEPLQIHGFKIRRFKIHTMKFRFRFTMCVHTWILEFQIFAEKASTSQIVGQFRRFDQKDSKNFMHKVCKERLSALDMRHSIGL